MTANISIFFGFHDSGVAISSDTGGIVCLQAERIFRKKHMRATMQEMEQLVSIALEATRTSISTVDTLFIAKWGCHETPFVTLLGRRFAPVWTSHHANHVGWGASLRWDDALAICADGGSENGLSGVYRFDGAGYDLLDDLDNSILNGRYYAAVTAALFATNNHDMAHVHLPGKAMGLAAFGRYDPRLADAINCCTMKLMDEPLKFELLLAECGLAGPFNDLDWQRWDFIHTAQRIWEDEWLSLISCYRDHSRRLILSGGCALNVSLNARIRDTGWFDEIFIPYAPGDDGQALGALVHRTGIPCSDPYLGRTWGVADTVPDALVDDLLTGRVIFWFEGASELGPRALGHRSILCCADSVEKRRRVSEVVKKREWYRPVAPLVLLEDAFEWFDIRGEVPWMSETVRARPLTRVRAPAVVHVDGTSRVQTLRSEQNRVLHSALKQYKSACGVPILINTSMNAPGEPICDSPDDAIACFRTSSADILYINGQRFTRELIGG